MIDFNSRKNVRCVPDSKSDFSLFHPIFLYQNKKTCCSPPVLLFQEIFNVRQVFLLWKKSPLPQNGPASLVWICVNEVLLFIQYNSNEPKVSNPNNWTCFQNHFESS